MIRQRNQDGDTFDWQGYDEPVARLGQGEYERRIYPGHIIPLKKERSTRRALAILIPYGSACAVIGAGVAYLLA